MLMCCFNLKLEYIFIINDKNGWFSRSDMAVTNSDKVW